jgi:DNA-directed RNA polymerase subunit alpha
MVLARDVSWFAASARRECLVADSLTLNPEEDILETNEAVVETPQNETSLTDALTLAGASELTSDHFHDIQSAFLGDSEDGRSLLRSYVSDWASFSSSFGKSENAGVLHGFALFVLGQVGEAVETLAGEQSVWGRYYYIKALLAQMKIDAAAKAVDETLAGASKGGSPALEISLLGVLVYCKARREEDALRILNALESEHGETSAFLFHKGLYLERISECQEAIEYYRKACDADDDNGDAYFRLGFCLDLYGRGSDENIDDAILAYENCLRIFPPHTNAVINLGILYEDRERYHDAIKCFEAVLHYNPNHERAKLFLEDAIACTRMFYDKEEEKKADRQSQVLKIPVSDFELSVRSRNCLQKMNINTLGDLIMKTEQELLSYKNFGETSLKEIKDMLTQKGLRLGQGLEQTGPDLNQPRNPLEATTAPDVLNRPIEDLNLSVRSRRCMERLGVKSMRDLINRTEVQLMSAKNFGMTSLNEIKRKLGELNLRLRG